MKLLILSIFLVASTNAGLNKNRAKEIGNMLVNDCKVQENGSDEDANFLINYKNPKTEAGYCMIACIHEKLGFFVDGTFIESYFMIEAEVLTDNNPKYMEVAKNIVEKCQNIDGTRCSQALDFALCMEEEVIKNNIEMQFM